MARLSILAAAVLFSTGGAAIKGTQLSGLQVACFRSAIACVALYALLPRARSGYRLGSWLVGVAYAATLVLFVLANKLTTAANSIFLQSTAPLYILIAAPILLKEPARRQDVGFMLAIGLGLGLFFLEQTPQRSAPNPALGNLLACCAGVTWAATLMGLRALASRGVEGLTAVVAGNGLAAAVCLPWALWGASAVPLAETTSADWLAVAYLGSIQIGLAYVLLTAGLRRVPALEASLLILLEPSLSPLWAFVFQGERPGLWSLLGGLLILGSSSLRGWLSARAAARGRSALAVSAGLSPREAEAADHKPLS